MMVPIRTGRLLGDSDGHGLMLDVGLHVPCHIRARQATAETLATPAPSLIAEFLRGKNGGFSWSFGSPLTQCGNGLRESSKMAKVYNSQEFGKWPKVARYATAG